MLSWIAINAGHAWGPLRLLNSFFLLAAVGYGGSALATWLLLPRLWNRLPRDQGRAFAIDAEKSLGKPVGAGVIFIGVFCAAALLFTPIDARCLRILPLIAVAMAIGYLDDRRGGFTEYQLAAMDAVVAATASIVMLGFRSWTMWLPGWTPVIVAPPWIALPLASGVVWLAINATNCSDGVDGLSGSLTGVSILILGGLLYAVIGNDAVAAHLRIPSNPQGADWAIMAFVMVGAVSGYLWFNAPPSQVLMGDAGSRPLGLLIGVLVVATGNPLFLLLVCAIIVLNGATGLLKVAAMRFLRIPLFSTVRFPLHDHCRKALGWSNSQVLVRFLLLHLGLSALLVILVLKIR